MLTGSYRIDDCLEVYDLRMFKRSRVIPWEGSGNQELLMYDDDGLDDEPNTDAEENKDSMFGDRVPRSVGDDVSQTTTTTNTRRRT